MPEHQYTPLGPASFFKILGNPLRLLLFEYLCHEELTVEDMMEITRENYQTIYTQLHILQTHNIIEGYTDGKYRYYTTSEDALERFVHWPEMIMNILKERKM